MNLLIASLHYCPSCGGALHPAPEETSCEDGMKCLRCAVFFYIERKAFEFKNEVHICGWKTSS